MESANEYQTRNFNALLQTFGLQQHVRDFTHYGHNGERNSILDLVISYTRDESFVYNVTVLKDENLSDHKPVNFDLLLSAINSNENPTTDEAEETNIIQQDESCARLITMEKYMEFVTSKIEDKPVTALPRIGIKYEANLKQDGIDKASVDYLINSQSIYILCICGNYLLQLLIV